MNQINLRHILKNLYTGGHLSLKEADESFLIFINTTNADTYVIPGKVQMWLNINDVGEDAAVLQSINWDLMNTVAEVIRPFWGSEKHKILIHCAGGNNRSAFTVAYVLNRLEGLPVLEGYTLCEKGGSEPQERFKNELRKKLEGNFNV